MRIWHPVVAGIPLVDGVRLEETGRPARFAPLRWWPDAVASGHRYPAGWPGKPADPPGSLAGRGVPRSRETAGTIP